MTWFNGIVAFACIFMLTLFCVLPIGVRTSHEAGEEMLPGQASSAPTNPRMGFKVLLTFLISLVIFGLFYAVGYFELIDTHALLGRGE